MKDQQFLQDHYNKWMLKCEEANQEIEIVEGTWLSEANKRMDEQLQLNRDANTRVFELETNLSLEWQTSTIQRNHNPKLQ